MLVKDSVVKVCEVRNLCGNQPHLLFIFHNPFLKANPDCVDIVHFHIVGEAEVDQTNKFHKVCVIP